MGIDGVVIIPMVDDDHVAVALKPVCINYLAITNSADGFASVGFYLDAAPEINHIELGILIWPIKGYYFTFSRHIKQSF